MTLASQDTKKVYVPDGTQVLYSVSFPIFSAQDVQCVYVDAAGREALITDFTVEGYGTEGGVYVRFASAPAAGGSLVLRRNTRQVQESKYPEGGKFPSAVVERDIDRVVGMVQELAEAVARSLKVNVGEESPPESAEELYSRIMGIAADADAARNAAQANAASANQSAINAAGSKAAAEGSAAEAGAARDVAKKWAENPENVPVVAGNYSAYHWAQKALENAEQGIRLSDALNGERKADDGYGASEWAVGQVNEKAENAGEAAEAAMGKAEKAGLPLFSTMPSTTGVLRPGYLFTSVDNGRLDKAAFPEAYGQLVQDAAAGSPAILTETAWQAAKTANGGVCPAFMLDEAAEQFRIPFTPGLYWRDADPANGLKAGMWQGDAMRPITGRLGSQQLMNKAGSDIQNGSLYWDDSWTSVGVAYSASYSSWSIGFDSSLLGPHYSGNETRPVTAVYPVMMKLYGAVVEDSAANIAALVQATAGKLDATAYTADLNNRWESEWFSVAVSGAYNYNHNLNIAVERQKIRVIAKVTTATAGWAVGDIIYLGFNDSTTTGSTEQGFTLCLTENSVLMSCGALIHIARVAKTGGTNQYIYSSQGQYKIIIEYT